MKAVERYQELDMTFSQTRECQFLKVHLHHQHTFPSAFLYSLSFLYHTYSLQDLIQQFEAGDVAQFTRVIADFDRMSKLDAWKTTILLRIKKQMAEEPSLT